jgi:hypothetical protein
MREQPVVSHPNSEAPGNPPQQQGEHERFPTEYEECCQCAAVEQHHEKGCYPDDWLPECSVPSEKS